MTLTLHNTLTRTTEPFTSQKPGEVLLYTCGPTVYNYLHVGNWAAYIYWDTLVRTLEASNYAVHRVMNITDVGHLTSDEDEGEDKLQKGARREGKTAWEVAEYYGADFLAGMTRLNLRPPEHITKATDYIAEQLALVRVLKDKGYTYQIDDGIYFDTAKFPTYADFASLDLAAQQAGARVEFNSEKRNPSDFALWKFSPKDEQRDMEWETPKDLLEPQQSRSLASAAEHLQPELDQTSGLLSSAARSRSEDEDSEETNGDKVMGFPGWHLECSAMAMSLLGNTLDIHTGGIDHIPVHHTNEIAQSEAASGKRFSNYWLHNNHLKVDGTKISKSLGNGYTLDQLEERGFSPLDYRMFVLQSHYRSEGNFTFDNLQAAKNRLAHWREVAVLRHQTHNTLEDESDKTVALRATAGAITEALADDLNTPEALKLVDEAFGALEGTATKYIHRVSLVTLFETIDHLLGLDLIATTPDISDEQKRRILERQRAREEKNWAKSDEMRDELLAEGVALRDTSGGAIWYWTGQ